MSTLDFNKRARLDVTIYISGSGDFDPLNPTIGVAIPWSMTGEIKAIEFTDERTVKEQLCGLDFGVDKQYRTFGAVNSNGNNSGTTSVGQIPRPPRTGTIVGANRGLLGEWTVNTSPVLSGDGKVDGEVVLLGYYTVAIPQDATADEPIFVDPPIDFISRVYPGDSVFVTGNAQTAKWRVGPQFRYPKPDRTFFWQPNSAPVLTSGGFSDGQLALPGTVMLPTANFYIEDEANAIDGMRYFYAGQGVIFDGQNWIKNTADPVVYTPQNTGPKEFWNTDVAYLSPDFYVRSMEVDQRNKPFIFTNQTIDDESKVTITYSPSQGQPYSVEMVFRWNAPIGVYEKNIQPRPVIYNFGDAWTKYHLNTQEWLNEKFPGSIGSGYQLQTGDGSFMQLGVDEFADGNVTEVTESVEDPYTGQTLTNTITTTLSVTAYME
jgi:hypothetical protein